MTDIAQDQPSKPTRLMIANMVLENFKSYAGVQEIGPFHKRFSAVVGPNGSGKSNVIDALLFVFGKRAKQLRLNKVSELIHKSSGFIDLEYARVSIHFQLIHDDEDSADDFEVVPGSEFVVTRIAYQNNQSKYTVDGKNSSFTEVGTLLRSYGIDLDNNRFLILQGEVEQIAMMKPKGATPHEDGLLEYLEDIIGSNKHVAQIEEASKSLDQINEQRMEKVNRLKIAERERENLSGSKIEAETFMEKDREIRRKHNVLYQVYERRALKNVEDLIARGNQIQEKLDYERAKIQGAEDSLKNMEDAHETARRERNAVDATLQKTQVDFSAFERRDVKLQEDMKFNKAQLSKAQASLAKEAKKETESMAEAEQAKTQIDSSRKQLDDLTAKKSEEEAKIEEIMSGLQEATKALRAQLEVSQGRLADAERSISSLVTDKEAIETSIKLTQARAANATSALQAMEAKLVKLQEDRKSGQSKLEQLEQEKKAAGVEIQQLEQAIESFTAQEADIQKRLRDAMGAAEEAKAQLAQEKSNSGANSVVANVLKLAKKGGPLASVGVRGRLGDLAAIDAEFDVAISTACSFLDFIVVDTTEGAQACMSYMREHNVGRASFVVLDQMSEWKARMSKPFETPAGTHRLFDVLQLPATSADVRPAFYMALKDTLVANDLDMAVKIAYVGDKARYRVVTKDGQLIDVSGTMSGGGNAKKSGCMRLASGSASAASAARMASSEDEVTPAMVKALEGKVEDLQRTLATCRSDRSEAEQRVKEVQKRVKAIHVEFEKVKLAMSTFEEQHRELSSRLVAQRAECSLSPEEVAEMQAQSQRLAAVEAEITRVSPDIQMLRLDASNIQRQILDVGGPKLARSQARMDLMNGQIAKLSSSLSTLEVEESNHRKQAIKAQQARAKFEKEVEKLQEKLNALLAEQAEMEQDALAVINALEEAKVLMEQKEIFLKSIEKQFNELKAAVNKIRSVEIDLQVELDKTSKDIAHAQEEANAWQAKLETLRQLHIDEQTEFNAAVSAAMAAINTANAPSSSSGKAAAVTDNVQVQVEVLQQLRPEQLDLAERDVDDIKREITVLEAEKDKLKSNVNMNALLDYLRKDAAYKLRLIELEEISEQRNQVRKVYEDLRRIRLEEFMTGFGVITLKLKEMYQMITLGGDAELELVDSLDPFSEGIVFSVRPPKKSWKNISNLSGGEKTLSSLALVFALHHFKPTPLYVMDEIDAALDFKNVSIVANYIKERTKNAQFVIISLRNNMFELADRLVGIYKTHDATKSVTINPKLFEQGQAAIKTSLDSAEDDVVVDTSLALQNKIGKRVLADATNRLV